jgi:hypothetical protein
MRETRWLINFIFEVPISTFPRLWNELEPWRIGLLSVHDRLAMLGEHCHHVHVQVDK